VVEANLTFRGALAFIAALVLCCGVYLIGISRIR
jgi:hypothetical protein